MLFSGITNFDLLGNFGSMNWLGNFYIIFSYNLIFAGATGVCLFTKATVTIRQEIFDRFRTVFHRGKRKLSFNNANGTPTSNSNGNSSSIHLKEDSMNGYHSISDANSNVSLSNGSTSLHHMKDD